MFCAKGFCFLELIQDWVNMIQPWHRKTVYAGSFDPPTNGHLWMIAEAQLLFDELVVAIGINPNKHSTYSIEERQEMLQRITANFLNVTVSVFENEFLVNYASRYWCVFLLCVVSEVV